MLQSISQAQLDSITLWYLLQHSLSSFDRLIQHFGSASQALAQRQQWSKLKLHDSHLKRLDTWQTPTGQQQFATVIESIQKHCDFVLCIEDSGYPPQLLPYSDKPPILFGQGNPQCLLEPQIAIVGSRKPSAHGRQVAYDFAYYLSEKGFYINSGLALGIDEAAHRGGIAHARTLAVMATGLETTYPQQHHVLRQEIIAAHGAVITEFLPYTRPLQHHFPRRNRIVSALSLGVVVAEATLKSGSLITAKLAAEQGKSIFAIPGHIYSLYHQGCHALIREGAILIDHPEQVVEDLSLATHWQNQHLHATASQHLDMTHIPPHLQAVYANVDWVGKDVDQLALNHSLDSATLMAYLMELELLGFIQQQGGMYLRCGQFK
jgi:DNA processing protein